MSEPPHCAVDALDCPGSALKSSDQDSTQVLSNQQHLLGTALQHPGPEEPLIHPTETGRGWGRASLSASASASAWRPSGFNSDITHW